MILGDTKQQVQCPYCGHLHSVYDDDFTPKKIKINDMMKDFKLWKCKHCYQHYCTIWNPIPIRDWITSDNEGIITLERKNKTTIN